MKTLILIAILTSQAFTYQIGGAYATLIDCTHGQYGYDHGYVGTYKVNGQIYRIFFKSTYCEY